MEARTRSEMAADSHVFHADTGRAEARTRIVAVLTAVMMAGEILAGTIFGSMALLADGWHMGTHVAAFLIAILAYRIAERNKTNPRFCFGTGKVGVLGGYTSSILLLVVAFLMVVESCSRFLAPRPIRFADALVVAAIGLAVNLVSAFILGGHHESNGHHGPHEDHSDPAHVHHDDKNLRAAYIHVITDAFTSVTAILALVAGLLFGITWIDALMGLAGSAVIAVWAIGLARDTAGLLTDSQPADSSLAAEIRRTVESRGDSLRDLHVWQLSPGRRAVIVSIMTNDPRGGADYRPVLRAIEGVEHLTVELLGPEAPTPLNGPVNERANVH